MTTNLDNFFKTRAIGFDELLNNINGFVDTAYKTTSFPPYNLVKVDDNKYVIEMAIAGFGKQNVNIELVGDKLKISGKLDSDEKDAVNIWYKGIARRDFNVMFNIAKTIEVQNAELMNGILKIWLENIIPDEKKPRKIEVKDGTDTKQVLKG